MIDPRLLLSGLLASPVLALAALPGEPAQEPAPRDPVALYQRAYWLAGEGADPAAARELFERVARESTDPELRARARRAAEELAEDLAAADLTRLMPRNTLAYLELQDAGERLEGLLSELGLLGGEGGALPGISPHLVRGLLGIRAAALGVLRFDPRQGRPVGLAILHPGSDDLARGLAETVIQNGALPADPIHGCATWEVPGQVHVTFAHRLILASQSPREIAAAVQRLRAGGASFADSPALQATADLRGEDLAFLCLNAEPLMPLVQMGLGMAAAQEPRLAAVSSLLDPTGLRAVAASLGLGREGLALDLAVQMKEGHSSRAYSFLRLPGVDDAVLDLVPEGAAFVLAAGLNEPVQGSAGLVDSRGEPVVTFLDAGRELFGNLTDVVLFGMPRLGGEEADGPAALPDVAAILRVADVERSAALWDLLLDLATRSSTGKGPARSEVAGATIVHYSVDGTPVHLARSAGELVLSPSRHAVERALVARRNGYGARQDEVLAGALDVLGSGRTLALVASPARMARLLEPLAPPHEREPLALAGELLQESVLGLDLTHSETRLAIHLGLAQLPDVSAPVAEAVARALEGTPLGRMLAAGPAPAAGTVSWPGATAGR